MFIRPALDPASEIEGARMKVRDPETMALLADEGEEKPETEYWLRRREEGGVEEKVKGRWPKKAVVTNLDGTPASLEGEPLKLTDEQRAKLPKLEPLVPGQPVEYATGVSDAPAAHEETAP